MRVLPDYQGRGLGDMLLRWELKKAELSSKRIFLLSSPEGRGLYAKHGFETVSTVTMDLEEYGAQGVYTQSAMVWTGRSRKCDIGI
jgi:predicted N-acetyltransferase YhbS